MTRKPAWFWPWMRWYLGEGEFKGDPQNHERRPLGAPMPIPRWAWEELREFVARRNKKKPPPPPPPSKHPSLAFWRRMGVWVTRIDHLPPSWLQEYSKREYPIVVVPCLHGDVMEVGDAALREYITDCRQRGFAVVGSQWGKATSQAEADLEAVLGAGAVTRFGFDGWIMNGEKVYEGGGKSAAYARQFRHRHPDIPFGWSPEPRISLDHAVLKELGVAYMPQAYPLENGKDVPYVVQWGLNFGYDLEDIIPLIQAYPSPTGERYPAVTYREQARFLGIPALILYTGNQALDVMNYWRELVVRR